MDKIKILKSAVKLVVTIGSSAIVRQIIENNVEPERAIDKVAVPVASVAIGGAVGGFAGEYTDEFIDDIVKRVQELKTKDQTETEE